MSQNEAMHLDQSSPAEDAARVDSTRAGVTPETRDAQLPSSGGTGREPQYEATQTGRTYTVQDGDTLRTIAAREYGSGDAWQRIWDANQDKLSNPDLLYPGQELALP